MAASGMMIPALMQAGQAVGASLPGFMQYFFGQSDRPYKKAEEAYGPHYKRGREAQNPFYAAGTGAIPQYQDWLSNMKDPASFINKLMGQYQSSPWEQIMQQQARRAGVNAASASGLIGSTPYLQQAQQNASQISQMDMQNWLKNVLGINTEYGHGQENLMTGGQHAADMLTNLENEAGQYYGGTAYGQEAGRQYDRSGLFSGITKLFGG